VTGPALSRGYSIKEVAALTGLPATTLRYYEQIGVITPISRGASSRHRVYDEQDLDRLVSVSCLAATGMSVSDMRQYMDNVGVGREAAADQRALLVEQSRRLAVEAEAIVLRQRYVELKITSWDAVEAGDHELAEQISARAVRLADELRHVGKV
jgi:DNA-binding transcriptional MerR regulator